MQLCCGGSQTINSNSALHLTALNYIQNTQKQNVLIWLSVLLFWIVKVYKTVLTWIHCDWEKNSNVRRKKNLNKCIICSFLKLIWTNTKERHTSVFRSSCDEEGKCWRRLCEWTRLWISVFSSLSLPHSSLNEDESGVWGDSRLPSLAHFHLSPPSLSLCLCASMFLLQLYAKGKWTAMRKSSISEP